MADQPIGTLPDTKGVMFVEQGVPHVVNDGGL
jgi:hypothetical protein